MAATFYMPILITESDGNDYTMLPIIADIDNDYLADNGFISATGLDTRVTFGDSTLNHMVADDKLLFVADIAASSNNSLEYSFWNSALTSFPVVMGYDGYAYKTDDAALEPADNFEIEISGYIDTSIGASKRLVYKPAAFELYVSGEEEITAAILSASYTSPDGFTDGDVEWATETNCYDENTATLATEAAIALESWSSYLALTHAAIDTSYIRYFAGGVDANITKIDVDVYYTGDSGTLTFGIKNSA